MKKIRLEPLGDGPYTYVDSGKDMNVDRPTLYEVRVFAPEKSASENGMKEVEGVRLNNQPVQQHVLLVTDHPANYQNDPQGRTAETLEDILADVVDRHLTKLAERDPARFTIDGQKNIGGLEVIFHTPENVTGKNVEKFEHATFIMPDTHVRADGKNKADLSLNAMAVKLGLETLLENRRAYPVHGTEHDPTAPGPTGPGFNGPKQNTTDNQPPSAGSPDIDLSKESFAKASHLDPEQKQDTAWEKVVAGREEAYQQQQELEQEL